MPRSKEPISHAELVRLLAYNPDTGAFRWKVKRSGIPAGARAGSYDRGFEEITVCGVSYYSHRLAWFCMTKEWPSKEIHHINGIRSDNRFSNLENPVTLDKDVELSLDELERRFIYDGATGKLHWKFAGHGVSQNQEAGAVNTQGYVTIRLNGVKYLAHRLIWFLHYGKLPQEEVDHINGDRADNRLNNLREATRLQNSHNTKPRKNKTSGYVGVLKTGEKWRAQIRHDGKMINLGSFPNPEAAHNAYRKKALELRGEFAHQSLRESQ